MTNTLLLIFKPVQHATLRPQTSGSRQPKRTWMLLGNSSESSERIQKFKNTEHLDSVTLVLCIIMDYGLGFCRIQHQLSISILAVNQITFWNGRSVPERELYNFTAVTYFICFLLLPFLLSSYLSSCRGFFADLLRMGTWAKMVVKGEVCTAGRD